MVTTIMAQPKPSWTMLVYKLPPQPTRLRIQVWRKLQALGAVYVQDGLAVIPSRDDLDENMSYISQAIEEMDGTSFLVKSSGFSTKDDQRIVERFQKAADSRLSEIIERLQALLMELEDALPPAQERIEEALKKERAAYLRARRLNYFGSALETEVDQSLAAIRRALDEGGRK